MFPQYNSYGRTFWIPTQIEPTVAMIGTSLPALMNIYSAASLQFSKLRSRLSSRRGSDSNKPYGSGGKTSSSLRLRAWGSGTSKLQLRSGSEVELHRVPNPPIMRTARAGDAL